MSTFADIKDTALDNALETITAWTSSPDDTKVYAEMQKAMSRYAQLVLMDKAEKSPTAAVELAKQYPPSPCIDYDADYVSILADVNRVNLNEQEMKVLRERLNLLPRFRGSLSSESIRQEMADGKITTDEAMKLMKIIQIEKDDGHSNMNLSINGIDWDKL